MAEWQITPSAAHIPTHLQNGKLLRSTDSYTENTTLHYTLINSFITCCAMIAVEIMQTYKHERVINMRNWIKEF